MLIVDYYWLIIDDGRLMLDDLMLDDLGLVSVDPELAIGD